MKDNTRSKIQELGEFGLIDALAEKITTRKGTVLGIGDDCAILETIQTPVVTLDTLVEGVHFRRDWIDGYSSPRVLGWKSLAVSVSDLAAKSAIPVAAFISLAVPKTTDWDFISGLYEGFERCASLFGFTIAGGDTVSSPVISISATLIGSAYTYPRLRSGAQVGDVISVTNTLGDSAAGLYLLQSGAKIETEEDQFLLDRHFSPSPRLNELRHIIKEHGDNIHAVLDLSDGLSSDTRHIAKRSNVSLEIDLDALPLSNSLRNLAKRQNLSPYPWAVAGGEDYELLICSAGEINGATPIGRVVADKDDPAKSVIFFENGKEVETPIGWRHF